MHHLTLKKLRITILLGVLLSCFAVQAQVTKPFTIKKQFSIKGDITMISNNIVNRKVEPQTWTTSEWVRRNGRWVEIITTHTRPGKEPNDPYPLDGNEYGSTANDSFDMRYIDVDGDTSTFSSSKATLTIPNVECSKVVYAALYWSATYRYNNSNNTGGRDSIQKVKIKHPESNTYIPIKGEIIYDGFGGTFDANGAYACYADVTSIIAGLTNPNGEYTIADIRATQGTFGGGTSGGWNLYIVYENPTYTGKYITSYDGFAGVNAALGSQDVPYSGFVTVPNPLPVKAKLAFAALEGDKQINGDQLKFKGGATGPFRNLSNTKNPSDNVFNSTLTQLNANNEPIDFISRVPNSQNTLGFDADIMDIPSGYLPNSATQATFQMLSTQDTYYLFFNALSVDIIEPDITIVKEVQRPNGVNWAGRDVELGWVLQYKLTFNNIGKDDARNFKIKDVLPVNTSLRSIDLSNIPNASYVPGTVPGEIIITVPDEYVTKESGSGEHYIIIEVKVAENCNDFTDACANRIVNTAYATYSGVKNSNVISDDPSVAGIGDCNRPEEGPANFIVDISRCEFRRSEIICNGTLNISAGAGYGQYEWYLKDPGGNTANDIPMGNTQQITVNVPGEYYVKTTPIAPCLVGTEEYVTVKNFNDLSAINPVAAVADKVERCENNGILIPKIFLCGLNDSRFIPSNISSGTVRWQKLNTNAPNCNVNLPDPCPQIQCTLGWDTVFTGPNYTVENDGEYRIEVDQNGCRSYYFFKVSKNLLNPTVEVKDVICGNPGEIKVLGVPAQNYQIRLRDQDTGTVLVDYPNTNPVFPVSALGVYTVEIKQTGVPAGSIGCEFKLKDIGVQSRTIRVVPVVTDKTCFVAGSIKLQVLDVSPQYTYTLKGGPNNIQIGPIGPISDNNYTFDDLLAGSYDVEITTEDNCNYNNTFIVNDYSSPQLTANVAQSVSCDPGLINLAVTGGKAPYVYATYSYNDVNQDPQVEDYVLVNPVEIELANIGKYVFIVKDANGCTAISNPVIINNIPGVTYTSAASNVLCHGGIDGSITFTVTANNGYNVSFELVNPLDPETILRTNATGQFTELWAGDYIVNVVQTGTNTCKFPVEFTIAEPAALAVGAATVSQQYTCTTTATISFDASTVSGGTAPYTYSINGTAFAGTTTFTGLTAGTYKVTVKDASGCTIQTPAVTVDPLTPVTAITFTATDVECPSLTSDVTLAATGGFGALTYKIIAPTGKEVDNASNPLFTGLDADTYTFEVTDAKGCVYTQNYVIDPITPVTVTAQKIKDIECLGDTNGSLTFTVGGAATYDYTVIATGPGTAVPAVTGEINATVTITDLAAGTYTVTVQDPVTKCTDDATITIDAPPSALSVTETVVQPTCTTGGSITVNAINGWGNYTYILSDGTTTITQSNPEFTDLANGTYELEVKDLNGCPYSATITLNAAVSPVLSIVTASTDLCYDADGASATVAVNAGTGKAPFRYSINGGTTYQASETFAGLVPGSYTITVLDANNCTDDIEFDINNRLLVSGDLKTAFDCEPAPDNRAVVEATITGGKAPYKYQVSNSNLNGGAYGSLITAGSATVTLDIAPADFGDYKIKIIDAAECTAETNVINVPQLSQPEIKLLKPTNVLCNGASTGAIQVDIDTTKGLAPYVINVSTATHDYGTQTTGLPAGDYTVKVTDSNGCSVTATASITELAAITFLTTEENIQCINDPEDPTTKISAGKILVHTVAGGTAPYTYELTNNFGYSAVPVTTSLTSHEFIILNYGIYQVVIKDANGCTAVKQDIIMASPPNQLAIAIDTTPSTCAEGGKAKVTVGAIITSVNYKFAILEDNVYPYSTNWVGPDDPNFERVATFTGLVPGATYTFVVFDEDTECYYFESKKIDDYTPSNLAISILNVNDVTCKGAANGNVIFSFSGYGAGATRVDYQVYKAQSNEIVAVQGASNLGNATITDTLTGLAPGIYYIQFQEVGGDHAGCKMASAQFTITESVNELLVNAEAKNANCNPNSGEITITGQGGAGDYSYQVVIDGAPQPTTWVSTNMFKRNSGNYDAYIKDANNCIVKADIFVPLDATPVVTASVATQCNTEDGSYTINVARTSNASPAPFTYSINGAAFQAKADTFTYDNLTSGTYQIRIKDGNGCIFQAADVIIHEPLDLMAAVSIQPNCDDNDGEITVTGIGGSAAANYEYELQGAVTVAAQPSNIFTGLKAGDYTVIIHDTTTNCTAQADITLEKAIEVDFTLTKTDVICNGGNTGTVTATINATNTDLPYTYSIANVAGTYTHNNVNNPVFTGLEADDYIVTVTSGKKCTKDIAITVGEPDALVANATATAFECAADNTVKTSLVTITATGGKGTYRYSRDGSNYIASNTFEVIDNGSTQSVTVYVKDANNCVNSYNFNIDPLPAMGTFTLSTVTAMTCTNDALVEVTVSGGSGNFKFEMLPSGTLGTPLPVPDVRKSRFTLTEVGTYTFKVTDLDTDCTKTLTHIIAPFDTIEVEAVSATAVNCYGASDGSITINVLGYTGAYNYEVYNGTTNVASGTGDFAVNPFTITDVPAGNLFVRVIATDTPFCSADTAIITVPSPAEPLDIPSIITANVTCSNDKGEISAQAKGGWGTYQYKLERTIPSYELVQDFDFNSAFTALEEGSYALTVKDSSGCEYSETVDLVRPTPITANIIASDTDVSCYGDGGITVQATNVSGGRGVYQYALNTYDTAGTAIATTTGAQTSPVFTGLHAGIYSITVTDGWSCDVETVKVTINQPEPLVVGLSLDKGFTCETDAQLIISAIGGTAPYRYSTTVNGTYTAFDNGDTSTIDITTNGTYRYSVKDANDCTAVFTNSVSIPALQPIQIKLNLAGAVINCAGENSAEISAVATAGLGNYEYALYNVTANTTTAYQPSGVFPGLSEGTYRILVKSGDCDATSADVIIEEPEPFVVTPEATDIVCFGEVNGKITITTTGGTGTVQYAISPNLNEFVDTNVFQFLSKGFYDVIAQDANGCFEIHNVEIKEPLEIEAEVTNVTNETCFGANDGTIAVSIQGGTGNYVISLDENGPYVPVTGSTYLLEGLPAGTSTIYVKDENGCSLNPPIDNEILEGVDLQPLAEVSVACDNNTPANNITITINPAVDTANVEYSIDGTTYQPSNEFLNVSLAAGTHTAHIRHTDGDGLICIKTADFVLTDHDALTASADVTTEVLCYGEATGKITVTASDGTAPIKFAISDEVAPVFVDSDYGTEDVFENLAAGNYTVSVKDSIGCEIVITKTIIEPTAALTATAEPTNEICIGANDGTITLVIDGGTAPYFTSIDGTNYTEDKLFYNNLTPGSYTVEVKDANDCTYLIPTAIEINEGVDIQGEAEIVENCTANVPGTTVKIDVNPSLVADVMYALDSTATANYSTVNEFNFTSAAAGPHIVYVKHSNGCVDEVAFTIKNLVPVSANASATADVLCYGGTNGVIEVTATGGTGTLQYALSENTTPPAFGAYQDDNEFTGLGAGEYVISVKDSIGCEFTTTVVTVDGPAAALTATAAPSNEICIGANDGTITITAKDGTGPYESRIRSTDAFSTDMTYTGLTPGSYTVTVKDTNDCTYTILTAIVIKEGVDIGASYEVQTTCDNNTIGNVVFVAVDESVLDDVEYSLDGGAYGTDPAFIDLADGSHTITVRHENTCEQTLNFTITNPDNITATASATASVKCYGGTGGVIEVTAIGGTGPLEYAISENVTPPVFSTYQDSAIFENLLAGDYIISIRDTNERCSIQISQTVTQPAAALTATVVPTNEICIGANDGTITITAQDGTGPYESRIRSTDAFSTDMAYTDLTPGSYTVEVKDANDCTYLIPTAIEIEEGVDIKGEAEIVENCTANVPGTTVTIDVNPSLVADVMYALDSTATDSYSTVNEFNFISSAAGPHIVYVKHTNGCVFEVPFTIKNLVPVSANASVTADVLCYGGTNGVIEVAATGGTGTLQYAISENTTPPAFGAYQGDNEFIGLSAGDYVISVKDSIGCEFTTTVVTVDGPAAALTATAVSTNEICIGANDGTITITAQDGTGPYESRIRFTDTFSTDMTYTNLTPGSYTVEVKDANDCTYLIPTAIEINEGVDIQGEAEIVENCIANVPGTTVTIDVNPSLVADVTYSLDSTATGDYGTVNEFNFTSAAAGPHIVYVKHTNGCVFEVPFTINNLIPVDATAEATADVLCYGGTNGVIEVTATGGTGTLQYAISENTTPPAFGAYKGDNEFTGLEAGDYVISVKDSIGCEFTTTVVTVDGPAAALTATAVPTNEICIGANDGTITITAQDGTGPYESRIRSTDAFSTDMTYTNLTPGSYTVEVKDANECTYLIPTAIEIEEGVDIQGEAEIVENCTANVPGTTVTIDVNPSLVADVTYSLDSTATGDYGTGNEFNFTSAAAGSHIVYVKHTNGCVFEVPFTINNLVPVSANALVTEDVLCFGGTNGVIEVAATGGTGTLQYAISENTTPPAFGAYQGDNEFTGLTAGDYIIRVKDSIGCEFTTTVVMVDGPAAALTASATPTNEICIGANDGTITITAQDGTGSYESRIRSTDAFSTDMTYTNLTPGSYTVEVKDANDCTYLIPTAIEIEEGVDIQGEAEIVETCTANVPGTTVTIDVNPSLVADVMYALDSTATGDYGTVNEFNFTSAAAGPHIVYVKHTNGCVFEVPFTINNLIPVDATAEATADVLCYGGTNGVIEVTATGGTGTLQYAISENTTPPAFGAYQGDNEFTGLAAGEYIIRVKDSIGCEFTTTAVTVIEPTAALTASAISTNEICVGANDGTITLTVSGGTTPYFTSIDGGTTYTEGKLSYSDLAEGTYTIAVKDVNNCTITQFTKTIEKGVNLNASLDIQTTCNSNTIGNVVFVLVNPDVQDDVEYSLDGGAFQDPLTAEFIDIADGSHTMTVRHSNGCEAVLPFTITSPDNITATASATANVLCYGGTDGVIEVTATGGTGTLLYSISNATPPAFADYTSSNMFSDLEAGTYTVSVMDDNVGCETQLSVTITQPSAALAATLAHTDEICFDGNDGTITVDITGGAEPYQISLNGGTYETVSATHEFTTLPDGSYTIDVKDANDCAIAQLTQVIQNGVNMQPSAVVTPNCVNNAPNNDVVVNIAAGVTGTVTYSINGTDYFTSNTFTNVGLAAGTYTAYVKHANGCIKTTTFTIDEHTPIAATAAVTENVLCFGAATGEITVTATGGTTPLQYAISPAYVYGSSNVFTGLEAGTYDVKVKDAISCEVTTTSVTVTQPAAALAATLAHTDEICFDGNDGTLTVNITGGAIPYEVSINGGAYTTATVYTALPDGTYTFDVKDANDCAITQLTQVIQNGVNMQPSAVVTPNCVNNAPNNDVVVNIAAGVTGTVTYSINGTDYFTSNTFTNVGLPAGTYTAYAKHANGCVQTDEFIIINHTPLMHTGTSTLNITCYGNDTGEATLSVSGGTAPVQYAMAPLYVYQDSNIFTGLAPGTYDFKVKDAIGCEIEVNDVTITEPFGPLAADVIHTDETCFNSNDGTITISITGGTPPYFTSLDGGPFIQDQTVYTDLTDGTHTINVTDAFACTIPQQSVVIVNGVNMQPVATVNPNCVNNTPNNDVVMTIVSGIPASDVMYSIDGVNYQPSGTFTNVDLPAGDYVASVEHSNGCIQTVPFTIAPHAPVTANVTNIVHVLCFDETTGQITVTASGGTTPLEYAIANEDTTPLQFSAYQPSAVFENLAAGMYTISVKDAIGCEVLLSGNQVDGPAAALVASATPTHESCINDDDGQIDITISGGTAPYATSLNGAAYVDGQLSYAGLDGGTYTVDVTDANGCHIGAPIAVTINDGVQLQASLNVTQVCEDVQVVVSVNPTSTGTVTYTLDGVYTQSSNTFNSAVTPMGAGQHTIAVTHSAGCTEELIFNVAPRAAIIINYTKTDVSCNGTDTGVVNVNATGGTGALQYALTWDIWPTPIYGTDTSFDELLGDKDYTIWVKDAMGCVETTTLRINQPAEKLLIASTVVRPETCILDRNGGIDITITGGTPPYLTALNSPTPNNFQPVTSYNNLIGGVYDVYVMDAAGCYVKTTVTVESGVNLDPYVETVMSCDNNVPVNTVTVKLRLTLSDVTYSLSPAGPFTANNVFEVASGQHTVYVRHKNGCEVAYPFTIQDRLPVTAQAASVAAKCNGEANGTITVTASGGTGAFKYAIANASVTPIVFGNLQNSNVFTGLAASNAYIVRVQDAYGCFTEVGGIIVSQPDAIVLSTPVIIQEEICINDNDAAIELDNPTGGTAPYATSLNAAGPFVTDQYLFDNLEGGKTYTIYVQDANGCIASTNITLSAPMDINAIAQVEYECEENTVTIITSNSIPTSQLTYIMSGPKGNYPPQTTNVYANLEDGKYVVEVVNIVTGCSDTTEQFTIENASQLLLTVTKTGLNQITATAVGGSGLYRYTFDGNDTGTKNTFTYYRTGSILVTVTDSRGCTTEAFIDAVFIDIIIPDVMTPDGDGQNDTWSPGNTQNYPNINTDIFDRYGRKLATLRQGQVWDGKYDGNEMPTGDYWYLVKLGDAEDRDFVGHFTIYR